uniref:Ig-like domain-containing protein n=1 Tax=Oryzias melastigma TaxID=30732 RepID=A0A3B3CEB9_ORYME
MRILIVITALLCSRSCICEFQTVEVQSGEDVTLLCSNLTKDPSQTDWFRVDNSFKVSCISSMFGSGGDPSLCRGFEGGKFAMSSNNSFVSLNISEVNESDSGLYFCGFYVNKHTIIGDVTQLIIEGDESNDKEKDLMDYLQHNYSSLLALILAVLMGFFMAVALGLVVVFSSCCEAKEKLHSDSLKTEDSSDLNSASLKLSISRKRRRPAESRELETCVMYSVRIV